MMIGVASKSSLSTPKKWQDNSERLINILKTSNSLILMLRSAANYLEGISNGSESANLSITPYTQKNRIE